MRAVAATAASVCLCLLTACTSTDSAACESAAWIQADAEQRWAAALEAHAEAHDLEIEHDDHPEMDIVGARVTMILAEADTRRECR